jgi:hypothetical protein
MISKKTIFIAFSMVFCIAVSCDRSRDSTEKTTKTKPTQAGEQGSDIKGLLVTAEVEKPEGKGETRPFVQPVMPEFVSGSLLQEAIAGEIAGHVEEIRSCYLKGLAAVPGLSGDVTVDFEIGDTGTVTASKVREKSLNHEATALCIADSMLKWPFPKPKGAGGVEVVYTFSLRPKL